MEYELIHASELVGDLADDWERLRNADPRLANPFFDVAYTATLGAVRDDVRVVRMAESGRTVGFFPFQRDAQGVGRPVGLRITDFGGLIAAPTLQLDAPALLRAAGLKAFYFDRWVPHPVFTQFQEAEAQSPWIDLSKGFDAYVEEKKSSGSRYLSQVARKGRKMAREVEPLQFELESLDASALETLIEWKSAQRRETQTVNVLDYGWVRELIARFLADAGADFRGILSTLRAGDRLISAHFGLRSGSCFHYWFPAYDRTFARYSPGLVLLLEMSRAVAEQGISRIDLGAGEESYKSSFESASDCLAQGGVDTRPFGRARSRLWFRSREWARHSPLGGIVKSAIKRARPQGDPR